MPWSRVRTFIVVMLVAAAATHLAWSSAMASILSKSYPHRIVDVRRWPEPVSVKGVAEMVSMSLSHAVAPTTQPLTVFFGSSVAYGFPWPEDVVVSTRYAALRPAERVVNASVIGNDVAFLENAVLCGATNAGLHADVAIVELPVINSVLNLMRGRDGPPPDQCDETIGRVGYWSFAARHPIGAGWLSFIWDDKAFPKPDANISIGAVYFGYFASPKDFANVETDFRGQVVKALERAKTLGQRVYAFPSPVFVPGVREAGYDSGSVQTQLTSALTACRTVPGVHCLDPQAFYARRDAYFNLTHLNQRGHQALAEWLVENIEPAK